MTTLSSNKRSSFRHVRSAAIDPHDRGRNLPLATSLPPGVWAMGIAGYLGLLASFWITFGGQNETGFILVIASLFAAMYCGLPYVMARTAARDGSAERRRESVSDFLAGEFDTFTGRIGGWSALIQYAFMPIALAFGALAIGIVMMSLR